MPRVAQVDLQPGCDGACPGAEASPSTTADRSCCDFSMPSISLSANGEDEVAPAALAGCGDPDAPSGPSADEEEEESGSGPMCDAVPLPAPRQWWTSDPGAPPGLGRLSEGAVAAPPAVIPPSGLEKAGARRTPLSSGACAYVPAAPPEEAAGMRSEAWHDLGDRPVRAPTTVMMRNLPYWYTRQMLIDLLGSRGFLGEYDFLYLPIDFESGMHVGYVFVNMISTEFAVRLMKVFNGFNDWSPRHHNKICQVTWGRIQGFHMNVERFETRQLKVDDVPETCKPVVFIDGVQYPFQTFVEKKQILKGRTGRGYSCRVRTLIQTEQNNSFGQDVDTVPFQ